MAVEIQAQAVGKRIVAVVALLLLAAGGYWAYRHYHQGAADLIQATGTIEATTVELNAKTAGTLAKLLVKEGDQVTAGQLAAEISRNDLRAQREQAALAVTEAEANLANLQAGPREQEKEAARANLADLQAGPRAQEKEEAVAAVEAAQVSLDKANADLARMESLYQNGASTQADYDQAQTNAKLAASQLKLAQAKLNLLAEGSRPNQIKAAQAALDLLEAGSRPEQIKAAQAEVERTKAVLKADDALLADLNVYVPVGGVVLTKNYEAGEYVQMGAALATVADLNDMWIKVYISTDDLPFIKLHQQVQFTVSGMEQVFQGTVKEIATSGEFTPKTIQTRQERSNIVYAVKIKINDGGGLLKPGMPADVTLGARSGHV
ncbi:MAG: HlyD family efflux transporter periplasmic adaptor subunit [Firmicutes bacterium]|nr:HlyD family efflux transporter periplasmic adaptor subunit [Bacillota bacterium]